MKTIDVAITGFGGVGRKVAELLEGRKARYRDRYGTDVRLVGVCRSRSGCVDPQGLPAGRLADPAAFTDGLSGDAFMAAVSCDVLFEASPTDFRTGGASLGYMRRAIDRGAHVVAVSKGALAFDFGGLARQAKERRAQLKFSGATGSALPAVDLIEHNLAGSTVLSVRSIVTGTTNIVLSAMMDDGCSLQEALREAQRLGIAEADPSLDIDGWDTACKTAILCNAVFGTAIEVLRMPRQGIGHVTQADVARWRSEGVMPRLVGRIDRVGETYEASVALEAFGPDHAFHGVHGTGKAIHVTTDVLGDLTVIGGNSSPHSTAAAALKDFEHILRAC